MAAPTLRAQIVATARRMNALGINRGAAGNVSARAKPGFLITPSAMAYDAMTSRDVVAVDFDGKVRGAGEPSTEWRFHRAIYVALPSPSIDWSLTSGDAIVIEARTAAEVLEVTGRATDGGSATVAIAPTGTRAVNYAFDVTPARLVTGYVTERGIAKGAAALAELFGRLDDGPRSGTFGVKRDGEADNVMARGRTA